MINQDPSEKNTSVGRLKAHVDGPLVVTVMLILAFGLIMLFSASMVGSLYKSGGSTSFFITRQILFMALGVAAIIAMSKINIRRFDRKPWVILTGAISFFLLVLVLVPSVGIVIQGARRWLPVPLTKSTFQPSEYTKIFTVFYMAWYYSNLRRRRRAGLIFKARPEKQGWVDAWEEIIKPMIPVVLQLMLISLQAHMSAVIIIILVCAAMMASAGLQFGSWLRGGLVGVGALTALVVLVLTLSAVFPNASFTQRWLHVVTRINIFTEDVSVTDDQRWQSEQALIAVGSGGITGVGLGQSRQKYLYLPENHNDYIFSILCEEMGIIGGIALILLFIAFLIAGMAVAIRTTTIFSRLIVCGYTYLLTLQAFLSVGVNLAVLPPTGISLPFFSYGGTSNLFFLLGVGLMLSVSKFDNRNFLTEELE